MRVSNPVPPCLCLITLHRESAGYVLESWWIHSSQGLRFYEW